MTQATFARSARHARDENVPAPDLLRPARRPGGHPRHQAEPQAVSPISIAILCVVAFLICWSPNQRYIALALVAAITVSGRIPRLGTPDVLALILAVWVVATLGWTPNVDVTLPSVYLYGACCLLFLAVRHLVTTRRSLLAVGGAYLVGCVIRAVQLIAESLAAGAPARGGALDLNVRYGIEGYNINFTAYSLVTGCVLAIVVTNVSGLPRLIKLGIYAMLPVLAYAVLLSGTRGALVALGGAAICLVVGRLMPRLCALIAAAAAPVALALVPLGITESALLWFESYLGQRTTGDLSGRLVVWPEALAAWSDSLFLGNGPGVFPISNSMGIGAHNLVLTVGNDLGLLGLLIYVAVVASALAVAWLRSASGPRLVSVFLIALLPIWLTGHWEVAMGFWLLLAAVSVFPSAAAAPSGVRQRAAVPTRGTAVGQLRQPAGFDAGVNPRVSIPAP